MPSSKVLKEKQESVAKLSEKVKEAKAVILVEYRGINVEQVTKMRADLKAANSEYKVVKNNIIKRALNENNISDLDAQLEGPVAVVLGNEDYLAPSKILYNFSKENDFFKIKAGIIDGKVVDAEEIITLAKLPSREELIAKLAGVLLANISKLAVALDQVKVKKEQEQ